MSAYSESDRRALENKCASLLEGACCENVPGLHLDGAENPAIFFAKQLAAVKSSAYEKQYPDLSGLRLFPMTSNADEGALYLEYYSLDAVGVAEVIANYASDLPRADVKGKPHRAEIVTLGVSYGYNTQELRAAHRASIWPKMGKPLDTARAEAARRANEIKVNHLIWNGDTKTGIMGVLSSGNNIPIYTLQNGASGKTTWKDKTADEIATDMEGIVNNVTQLTKGIERPDSWVMPEDLYTTLSVRRIDGTGESVLGYLKKSLPQIKNWEYASELSASNTDYNKTGKNIGLLYTKNPEKMAHECPMPFKQLPPQERNLEMVINCESRDAGMVIPYPMSACLTYGL